MSGRCSSATPTGWSSRSAATPTTDPRRARVDATPEVAAALENEALVPHPSPGPSKGATARLRAAMARFSGPDTHAPRRVAVVDAIARIVPSRARAVASELTIARLTGDPVDAVAAIGRVVPTEALATCVGLAGPFSRLLADVEAIVRVIGRGEPATSESDAATDRVLDRCRDHPSGPLPVVSMLYQNFDATAALVAVSLAALGTGQPAVPAVPRTRRVAVSDVRVAGHVVAGGSEVLLEIGAAGLLFGAGPHQCPGQVLAEAIVAGIVSSITDAGYIVDTSRVKTDADGRPTSVPIRVRPGTSG